MTSAQLPLTLPRGEYQPPLFPLTQAISIKAKTGLSPTIKTPSGDLYICCTPGCFQLSTFTTCTTCQFPSLPACDPVLPVRGLGEGQGSGGPCNTATLYHGWY